MSDEAERIRSVRFPDRAGTPARPRPRPTGTLEEILSRIDATLPADRLAHDLDRIEGALARLERAMRMR
jgi:hypothetical protein